jgi:hypothetical protein
MKNVEPTPNRLSLQLNNSMASIRTILFGGVFVVVGLCQMIFARENATLTCQRVQPTEGSCLLDNSRLLIIEKTTMPLSQLKSAKVDEIASGHSSVYRVVLLTYTGKYPLTKEWSSDTKQKQENVDQINAFISNPEKTSLRVQQGNPWFSNRFAGISILIGGWALGSLCVPEKVKQETIENR